MNLKAGLYQQQTLKLAMTQELSQAIALLQYSTQELASYLENKATENPLISLESRDTTVDYRKKSSKKQKQESDPKYWIEQIGEVKICLEDHLMSQVHPKLLTNDERKILKHLIRNLDENGYFRVELHDIALEVNESVDHVEQILFVLQGLEPAGVGARSLQECLLLQIQRQNSHPLAYDVINNFFIPFAEKKWKLISKDLKISLTELQEVFDFVQTLQPRPCARFSNEKPSYIVPDVVVESIENTLHVRLADDLISKVKLNEGYYKDMNNVGDKQVNRFLQDKFQEYQWIMKSIQQRRETILRVMTAITERQPDCLTKGFAYLKPMTMKEIADELNIHESTVSRTVKDKYVQAPFGTVEMREFFSSSLQSLSSEDVSAKEAKNAIQTLIANEDKKKPLSDQDISEVLKQEKSIILSRRTVAKYRDQLNIPSSSKRKRF
ncbi:RNA polymerase factor sigma-54 [Bacillus massiliigorillae]|uniref:RNA polymerase factor sigma-54 n=1 Tax=Bacillus massiliigorillae TaxID=1243664 RepID=UPI0003A4A435|nr:RNA polymerase factor sigma-54 [Bacillus massiliigorillae]